MSYGSAMVHGMALWCEGWLTGLGLICLVGWLNQDLGVWLVWLEVERIVMGRGRQQRSEVPSTHWLPYPPSGLSCDAGRGSLTGVQKGLKRQRQLSVVHSTSPTMRMIYHRLWTDIIHSATSLIESLQVGILSTTTRVSRRHMLMDRTIITTCRVHRLGVALFTVRAFTTTGSNIRPYA